MDGVATANDGQTAVSCPTRSIDTHEDELLDGCGSQAITADLVARETCLIDKKDVNTKGCQMIGGRCTTWASADNNDISVHVLGLLAHHASFTLHATTNLYRGPVQTIVTGIRSRESTPKSP